MPRWQHPPSTHFPYCTHSRFSPRYRVTPLFHSSLVDVAHNSLAHSSLLVMSLVHGSLVPRAWLNHGFLTVHLIHISNNNFIACKASGPKYIEQYIEQLSKCKESATVFIHYFLITMIYIKTLPDLTKYFYQWK